MLIRKSLLLATICISFNATKPKSKSDCSKPLETIAKVGVFTTIAASCGYGIYKFGQWLFTKSDEQIYEEAHQTYRRIHKHYNNLIIHWHHKVIHQSYEHFLRSLSLDHNKSFTSFLLDLKYDLIDLMKQKKYVYESILNFTYDHHTRFLLEKLKGIEKEADLLIDELTVIYKTLSKHETYFLLTQEVQDCSKKYQQELALVFTNYHSKSIFTGKALKKKFTKACVQIIMRDAKNTYTFIAYIESLGSHINSLQKLLKKTSQYTYPLITSNAAALIEDLSFIHTTIIDHPRYHNELLERKRDKLLEQQLENQREITRLQEQQMHAMNCQNILKQQEIYLKVQELQNQERLLYRI